MRMAPRRGHTPDDGISPRRGEYTYDDISQSGGYTHNVITPRS